MLPLLDFALLVQRFAAGARAASSTILDFTVGSVLRALAEGQAAVLLWLQWLILLVQRQSRLTTSVGPEVDSFVQDFGMSRLPAQPAAGQVQFARYTPTLPVFVPVGTAVRTADGTQTCFVVADTTNALWQASPAGFLIPAGQASATLQCQNPTAGSAGNIAAGTIALLASSIAIDTVSNALPFAGGADAESDASVQARFVPYINSRARATPIAIAYAILAVQQGLSYAIEECIAPDGTQRFGFFTVYVDDGTGYPSSSLITAVSLSIEQYRPVGVSYAVLPPIVVQASISMTITVLPGYIKTALVGPVAQAVLAYVDGLQIGQALIYTRLCAVPYGVPGVATVETVILNNAAITDIGGGVGQVVKATLANVAVN